MDFVTLRFLHWIVTFPNTIGWEAIFNDIFAVQSSLKKEFELCLSSVFTLERFVELFVKTDESTEGFLEHFWQGKGLTVRWAWDLHPVHFAILLLQLLLENVPGTFWESCSRASWAYDQMELLSMPSLLLVRFDPALLSLHACLLSLSRGWSIPTRADVEYSNGTNKSAAVLQVRSREEGLDENYRMKLSDKKLPKRKRPQVFAAWIAICLSADTPWSWKRCAARA